MPKQYKATCTKHEGEELTSFPGEDLDHFKKRMTKQGHTVGELSNAEYMLTDRGNLVFSELMSYIEKASKALEEIKKEYKKVEGVAKMIGADKLPAGGGTGSTDSESEGSS